MKNLIEIVEVTTMYDRRFPRSEILQQSGM